MNQIQAVIQNIKRRLSHTLCDDAKMIVHWAWSKLAQHTINQTIGKTIPKNNISVLPSFLMSRDGIFIFLTSIIVGVTANISGVEFSIYRLIIVLVI